MEVEQGPHPDPEADRTERLVNKKSSIPMDKKSVRGIVLLGVLLFVGTGSAWADQAMSGSTAFTVTITESDLAALRGARTGAVTVRETTVSKPVVPADSSDGIRYVVRTIETI
jgi:hypothetical protein